MRDVDIAILQEQAQSAFERVPQSEAAAWLQCVMLAEIALQLDALNKEVKPLRVAVDCITQYMAEK